MKENDGKFFFGTCKVGEKGQIVIPKDARKIFDIKPGDSLAILGDIDKGIAVVKSSIFNEIANKILGNEENSK